MYMTCIRYAAPAFHDQRRGPYGYAHDRPDGEADDDEAAVDGAVTSAVPMARRSRASSGAYWAHTRRPSQHTPACFSKPRRYAHAGLLVSSSL